MTNRNRALRRHHQKRLKAKRGQYNSSGFCQFGQVTPRNAGVAYHTPCRCSCWMCGNQRQHFGANMQERRAELKHKD
ncbi:Phage protein [Sodalis praecaptivus]|uniref:Phage protein n=1 Tax=Sodalis praecaptivus TaxID=1239307 RepID=W0I086_9GAMM|nr:Phage protein [Sodalis praecaptivus]